MRDRECISAVPHLNLSSTLKLKGEKAMKSLTTTPTFRILSHQKEDLPHSCSWSWCREQMLLLFCVYPFFLKLPPKASTEILSSSYVDRNVKPRLQPWICSWTLLAVMPQSCLKALLKMWGIPVILITVHCISQKPLHTKEQQKSDFQLLSLSSVFSAASKALGTPALITIWSTSSIWNLFVQSFNAIDAV